MTLTDNLLNSQSILAFPFRDPQWVKKTLLGAVISLAGIVIPILPWIVVWGYISETIRRVHAGELEPALPEWSDLSGLLNKGLRMFGAVFIYMLPMNLLLFGAYVVMMTVSLAVPLIAGAGHSKTNSLISLLGGLTPLALMPLMAVGFVLMAVTALLLPAVIGEVAVTGEFSAAFRFKTWWRKLTVNWSGFLLVAVLYAGLTMAMTTVFQVFYMTLVCCPLGFVAILPAGFLTMAISAALVGQAMLTAESRLAAAPEAA